ncbi:MAG: hypothetical protein COB10_05875 [Planctomycetota bacterium]|nr:MAG: hypothetical protein COB10_05875 [Planctomycetota bacterium]HIC22848.1 hypothetical protein [Planctomycetota bacterium]
MAMQKPELLPEDVCPCLRTKTMVLNTEYRRSAFEDAFTADTAFFHCLRTMAYHGPDGDDVSPDGCRPGRSCYPSPADLT